MRADAQANRRRLLDAAEVLFAEHGTHVSVAEIVAAAGVGPPTLYRHFGTKDGLIHAVDERRSEVAAGQLARALAQPTGWEGLRVAVEGSIEIARASLGVRQPRTLSMPASLERTLLASWSELVERGRRDGSVRPDLTATDVPYLFTAIAAAARATRYRGPLQDRYVALIMDGLRPAEVRSPLPGPAPTLRDVHGSFAPGRASSRRADATV